MTHPQFDLTRAQLDGKPVFQPLQVDGAAPPLRSANLPDSAPLVIAERNGHHIAFLLRQLTYHHLAQGELAGEPYLVSF